MTTNEMKSHSYKGEFNSAIARAKKILLAAGFPWSKTIGRYSAFSDTRYTTVGVKVARIGCSETIAIHTHASRYGFDREGTRLIQACAIATLREAGMPFDDRGWLACGRDAERAQKGQG